MKERIFLLPLLVVFTIAAIVFLPNVSLRADDREIFSSGTKPNIILILDNSKSMIIGDACKGTRLPGEPGYDYYVGNDTDDPTDPVKHADYVLYTTFSTYKTSTGATYEFISGENTTGKGKDENGRKITIAKGFYTTRLEALKRVTIQLLDVFRDKANLGIATYFYSTDECTWLNTHGAVIRYGITDLGTGHDTQLNTICNTVKSINSTGYTPLAESLDTCYGYFANKIHSIDGNKWTDHESHNRIPDGHTPPTQWSCQQNYIILITDGLPTADDFSGIFGNGYGSRYTGTTSKDLPAVAKWIYNSTLSQDAAGIYTWAVGMKLGDTGETLLKNAVSTENGGHGKYIPGNNFTMLQEGLISALEEINLGTYAFSAYTSPKKITPVSDDYVAFNGFFLNKRDTPIWEGHLQCMQIEETKTASTTMYSFSTLWDAAKSMYTQGESARKLYTRYKSGYDSATGQITYNVVEFKSTSTTQWGWDYLLGVDDDTEAAKVIQYIRGDATARGVDTSTSTLFLLADIFHSDVTYVGQPMKWKWIYNTPACDATATSTDADCFQYFYNQYKDRQKALYVGTNDGVVHAIAADKVGGGKEISGFIPEAVLPKLKKIALDKKYTYTTDGRMTNADIYSPTLEKWQSIIAYGLREGGKFYFCQDVTDPGTVSSPVAPVVKWKFPAALASGYINATSGGNNAIHQSQHDYGEFKVGQVVVNEEGTCTAVVTAAADKKVTIDPWGCFKAGEAVIALPDYSSYVGQTWGKPVLGRLKYKKGTGATTEAWVAILTGGYGDGTTNEGKALFVVDADTGNLIWRLAYATTSSVANDYNNNNTAEMNYPIPQSITAVDLNNDLFIDVVYFGNTGGNLFKLDLSDPLTTTWLPKLLFKGSATGAQPIYLCPSVSYDKCYKLWVHFGTSDRRHPQSSPKGQFFAIMDNSEKTPGDYPLTATTTDLQKLTWNGDTTGTTTVDVKRKGWYFDFPDEREKIFEPDPIIIPNNGVPYLYFNTYQPSTAVIEGNDPCVGGGNMHIYTIKLPLCYTSAFTISGERDEGRLPGGGIVDDGYLQPVNESNVGSTITKDIEKYKSQYPGGVIYFKEIIR